MTVRTKHRRYRPSVRVGWNFVAVAVVRKLGMWQRVADDKSNSSLYRQAGRHRITLREEKLILKLKMFHFCLSRCCLSVCIRTCAINELTSPTESRLFSKMRKILKSWPRTEQDKCPRLACWFLARYLKSWEVSRNLDFLNRELAVPYLFQQHITFKFTNEIS